MDFYALNETPINGWQTLLGLAEVDLSLAVTGKSANVRLGGADVDMELDVTGGGTRRTFGTANPEIELDATGDGTRRTFGSAEVDFELSATGDGKVTQSLGGTATLLLTWPEALGGKLVFGTSEVDFQFDLAGDGRAAVGQHGESYVLMSMAVSGGGHTVRPVRGHGIVDMWLDVTGAARLITSNGGEADLQLLATGAGHVGLHLFGKGAVRMQLTAPRVDSRKYRQVNGVAELDFTFTLDARDQRVVVLPSTFYLAPLSQRFAVPRENRVFRVPADHRTFETAEA